MHTSTPDGFQYSLTSFLTESGYITGSSTRYDGASSPLGSSAWLHEAATSTTTRLGYADLLHTRSDGYQDTLVTALTESGYVGGRSERYNGGVLYLGETAWVFDANTDQQYFIVLSERSDGYADASVSFLGEGGLALGTYTLFDTDDTELGERAFAWTADYGAVDLGGVVAGGLTAAGWISLADAVLENGLYEILGHGRMTSGSDLVYLLTPSPECNDGADNDGDGFIDFPLDVGCGGPTSKREDPACEDGIDNDGDGLVDYDGGGVGDPDPQCQGKPHKLFEKGGLGGGARSCGAGPEVVLLLLVLMAARRRGSRRHNSRILGEGFDA